VITSFAPAITISIWLAIGHRGVSETRIRPHAAVQDRESGAALRPDAEATMADVNRGNRPLSPHLDVYRLSLTMATSIFHRITGCALAVSAILVVWWFLAAARGPERFAFADWLLTSWVGGLVLLLSAFALWFHFCNGIRHLIWDTGAGYDIHGLRHAGLAIIGCAAVLTVITLIVAWT
jgi:succinate dehydrogenase / fumarate reductase cytochrome b subunit